MSDYIQSQLTLNQPTCVLEIIDEEAIIIHSEKGSYYNLPPQSTLIIQTLFDGFTLEEIFTFNGFNHEIKQAIIELIKKMMDEGLLVQSSVAKEKTSPNKVMINDPKQDIYIEIYTDMKEMLELDPIHEADETVGWPRKK